MKILYISTALSAKEFAYLEKEKRGNDIKGGMQESSNKFHGLIIDGLAQNGCEITAISGLNVSTNTHKKKVFKKTIDQKSDNVTFIYPLTLNIKFLKQIFNSIIFFIYILQWLFKNKKDEKQIIIDAAYVSVLPSVNLATKFIKTKKIAIVADIYSYMADIDEKSGFIKKIVKHNYKQINGFVFLTEQMNGIMNPNNVPFMIMEGLVSDKIPDIKVKKNDKYVLMYAGAIRKKFGLEDLVNSYLKYDNPDSELWIFGDGDYKQEMLSKIENDKRIKYFGTVSNEIIIEKEMEATLLINPRNSKEEFTKYSFPSKNMEYLLSGTPMIAYKLPGIPDEYDQYINYISDSKNGILEAISEMFSLSKTEINIKGKKGQDFVLKNKNNIAQTKKILDLIKIIGDKDANSKFSKE